jgi:hypothetical protein
MKSNAFFTFRGDQGLHYEVFDISPYHLSIEL